jgi:Protein of unknown function (DUF429)
MSLLGVDFTSAPSRRKPITCAQGQRVGAVVRLQGLEAFNDFAGFEALLARPGPWLGAFDVPLGLPRAFVDELGLGDTAVAVWQSLKARCGDRMGFRALVDVWGQGRPAGQRLIHRVTDRALTGLSSTSPLQTRYVPVGFMYFEAVGRLQAAGVSSPGLWTGDDQRLALEGYPAAVAHEVLGARSYKNSDAPDRFIARKDLVDALEQGRLRSGLRLKLSHAQRESLIDDASGDLLDAVLCLMQAAWASTQPNHGLPQSIDPVEGWILGALQV